jgi:hypothetical protein
MQYCSKCGNKLEQGVKFCPNCGEGNNINTKNDFIHSSQLDNFFLNKDKKNFKKIYISIGITVFSLILGFIVFFHISSVNSQISSYKNKVYEISNIVSNIQSYANSSNQSSSTKMTLSSWNKYYSGIINNLYNYQNEIENIQINRSNYNLISSYNINNLIQYRDYLIQSLSLDISLYKNLKNQEPTIFNINSEETKLNYIQAILGSSGQYSYIYDIVKNELNNSQKDLNSEQLNAGKIVLSIKKNGALVKKYKDLVKNVQFSYFVNI